MQYYIVACLSKHSFRLKYTIAVEENTRFVCPLNSALNNIVLIKQKRKNPSEVWKVSLQ